MLLSDREIVANFMEPKPVVRACDGTHYWSPGEWWELFPNAGDWTPVVESLDHLRLAEARLTEEQWDEYASLMMDPAGVRHTRFLLHASAEQKIAALGPILRPLVEGADHA